MSPVPGADAAQPSQDTVIEVDGVVTRFGAQTVHDGLNLQVRRGELVALIGGSGSGKSVLLREILGLQRPTEGTVHLLGTDMWHASDEQLAATRKRFGMMFQEGALFSSLDVAGNVATPLLEHTDTPARTAAQAGEPAPGAGRACRRMSAQRCLRSCRAA